jgi:uncharacterized Ntn-hydrolase superfamily protein
VWWRQHLRVCYAAAASIRREFTQLTFSIIARCLHTGAFGGAVGTSSIAAGNRCLHLRHGVGAFLSQHRTDPRLGEQGITLMAEGLSATRTMERVVEAPDIGWRQLAALDASGDIAVHHGDRLYSIATHTAGDHCVAIGNILANDGITDAMIEAFMTSVDQPIELRLLKALEAGRDAGGEVLEPLLSAALRVTGPEGLDTCDIRVDMAVEAVGAMRALLAAYGDHEEHIMQVAVEPESVPVSRALFEASVARIAELGLEQRYPTASRRSDWTLRD